MYDSGDYTVARIADDFGVARPTIYRHLAGVTESDAQKAEAGEAATQRCEFPARWR